MVVIEAFCDTSLPSTSGTPCSISCSSPIATWLARQEGLADGLGIWSTCVAGRYCSLCLKLGRGQVSQARVQPLGVVDVRDEVADAALGLGERFVLVQVDLLALERLEEALGRGVLIRVAGGRHTHPCADRPEPRDVLGAGVLDASVRVVDQARGWLSCRQRLVQSGQRQTR